MAYMRGEVYIYRGDDYYGFSLSNDEKRIAYNKKKYPSVLDGNSRTMYWKSNGDGTSTITYRWYARPFKFYFVKKSQFNLWRARRVLEKRMKDIEENGREAVSISLPVEPIDEFVVMRYAQMTQEERVEAEQRAVKNHQGNFSCDPLCEKYGVPTAAQMMLDELSALGQEMEGDNG